MKTGTARAKSNAVKESKEMGITMSSARKTGESNAMQTMWQWLSTSKPLALGEPESDAEDDARVTEPIRSTKCSTNELPLLSDSEGSRSNTDESEDSVADEGCGQHSEVIDDEFFPGEFTQRVTIDAGCMSPKERAQITAILETHIQGCNLEKVPVY